MPVKKDADTNDGEGVLTKRISRRVREADFVYQGGARERVSSKKGIVRGRHSQESFFNRLVKIELDAAEALADFARLAHMPTSKHSLNNLKWSAKRRRSTRSYEASSVQVETHTAYVPLKNHIPFGDSQRNELDSMTSVSQSDKASPLFNCQAESPSSPLPTSKLACRTFLVDGGLSSKSAFQRVIPAQHMQNASLTPIKTEMEEMQPEIFLPARPMPRTTGALMSLCSVKTELLGEQEEDCKDVKGAEAKGLTNLASELVKLSHEVGPAVLNKPKAGGLSEEDKEARRLRRIQANRESARQTIRKKQILCEELRRQALSLTLENEGMKQKKETLMQELYFLKGQNYHLKNELEMGPSCKLEPGMLQHSQGIPVSSPAWQAPTLPYPGFPSNLFGWPRIMAQGAANCPDWPNKMENLEEHSRNLASDQSMQRPSTVLIVPGIPISSPICATGVAEQKCKHISSDACSLVPTSSHHDESGAPGAETLASCDVDSATSNALQGVEKELDVISLTKPEIANPMPERGTLCRPTAIVPFRGDSGSGEKQSKLRTVEKMENHSSLPVALSVTCGSPCTGSRLADLYAWRTTQRSAAAAAEARKRRMELTRKKRSCSKRSKQAV